MANNQTLRQLAEVPIDQQPLCIAFSNVEVPFKLKSSLIHLLSTFYGLQNEDPHNHLKEFHIVCSSMKPWE